VYFDALYKFCVWNISYCKNSARYYHKGSQVFMQNNRYSRLILRRLEFVDRLSKNTRMSNLMKKFWVGDLPVVKISSEWVTGPYVDTWDRNGSTSGPTPWKKYDDDDDDNDDDALSGSGVVPCGQADRQT